MTRESCPLLYSQMLWKSPEVIFRGFPFSLYSWRTLPLPEGGLTCTNEILDVNPLGNSNQDLLKVVWYLGGKEYQSYMVVDLEKKQLRFCQKIQTNFSVCLIHYKFEFELHREGVSRRGNKLGVANLIRPNFNANFLAETIILKQSNFPIMVTEVCQQMHKLIVKQVPYLH